MLFYESVYTAVFIRQFFRGTEPSEDAGEFTLVRTPHEHFVLNPAQEGFVSQLVGFEVGGKDQECLKRNCHFPAAEKFQVVHAPFHGNDPAIEHLGGTAQLASEVVNQINAVVGLQLVGCIVDLRGRIVVQIQHRQSQFTAGDDEGTAALDPAAVIL